MSFYARQMLHRQGPFGQPQHRHPPPSSSSSRDVTARDRRDHNGGGGGGIARFSQQKQPHRQNQRLSTIQNQQQSNCLIFQDDDDDEDEDAEHFPIEGSIHAQSQREDRAFSQVTLSQLSDGPSVRSLRSQHSLSHRHRGGSGGGQIAPATAPTRNNNNSSSHRSTTILRGSSNGNGGGASGRVGHHFNNSTPGSSKQKQHPQLSSSSSSSSSKLLFHADGENDTNSLKSSQTLLSQYHRPSSNGGETTKSSNSSRPSSSQSGLSTLATNTNNKRTSSRGSGDYDCHQQRSSLREENEFENNSILSSQPLLPIAGNNNAGMSQQQRHQPKLLAHNTPNLKHPQPQLQHQQQHQHRTPSCLSNLPSLREHGKQRSYSTSGGGITSNNTTIRTIGAISGTLASLPNPCSQALRSMRSMAVRTTSNLAVALTPFRKGRLQNTAIGSSSSLIGGTPLLSSMKRTLAFTPSTPMVGKNALASASAAVPSQFPKVANMNPTHASNPATLLTSAMPPPPPPPSVQAEDDQSKPTSTTKLAEPSVGLITESTSNPVFETIHADGKDSTISTTNTDDLNDGTTEAILATTTTTTTTATRELQIQLDLLEKSKQEFHDMSERVRREMREEYAKLETLQKSMDDKYGTLQTSMDTYSRNMASCAHDHELSIRTLVSTSMNDLRQESSQATDAISTQVHEQVKALILPSDIRTLVETETRHHLSQTLSGMVDSAKSEFQQWIGGVVKNVCMIGGGFVSGESPGSFAFRSTALGGVDNAIDNVASGLIRDPLLEPPRNAVVQHDTANDKDACARVGDPIIQRNANDDNQLFGCKISTASHLDGVLSGTTPVKSILPDLDAAAESSYDGIRAAKDTTPCERKKDSNTSSLTPIPRSSMSTWTTPFSRKATPLKNNYAKNKLLGPSNSQTHRDIASEVKLDNLSILGKLPEPPSKLEQYQPASAKSETSSSSSDESPSLVAVSTSGSKANVRVVMNASPNESIPTVKRTIGSTPKDSKRKTYGRSPNQTLVNITSKTVNSKDDRDVTAIDKTSHTKKVHAKHQRSGVEPTRKKVSRKRDQSEMTEDKSISPRRSKRQREAHRVRPVASGTAVVCGNRKPCKVTPKEDQSITTIVKCNYDWLLDADSTKSNSVDHASTSNRYDSLLGTSVTVPTATATTQNSPNNDDDNLFGLDDGNMEFSQRSEKRSTLTSLLPFVNGFGHRSSTKKTFSKKKRAKNKISASFDFEDFNFS